MPNNIEQILDELYQTDPTLRKYDPMLRKVVADLVEMRPDTQFNEQFKTDLRRKVMNLPYDNSSKQPLITRFMKRFQLVGAGVAFVAVLAVSVWYLKDVGNPSRNMTAMLSGPKITQTGSQAFGSLTNIQAGSGRGAGNNAMGAESLTVAHEASVGSDPSSIGMGVDSNSKMIAPMPVNFRYVYKGEDLTLTSDSVDVLKRVKQENDNSLMNFISGASLGLINLNSFNNSQLQSFSFAEDRDMGYMVNVSLSEGSVSINENWLKWQTIYNSCPIDISARPCMPQENRVNISQVPSDQVLIDAANDFVAQHDLPKNAYGDPFVNNDWRVQYQRAEDKAGYWIPDVMNVVYPLIIDGQTVYDESGNSVGMNVAIRISPEVKVSGVWDLTTQNYQSSSYQAETSVDRIMKLVSQGGFRNYSYSDGQSTVVDVELDTPKLSMVKVWNYRDNLSEELLVPALIFPITKEPEGAGSYYWYRKNVVIPLVKEILDNENGGGPIQIMPASPGVAEPAIDMAR